ncbi:aldo/keto reductase [Spirochaeta cellobiosiphila]|uniref:aldo/keto reductase n=1 Tax=Spirochaeta cellobiosiphila TaxID=504483 RepID=UPI00040EEC0F|nr:aldo/keto reductase [Spirochaeta cellobiosiphila]
MTSLTDCYTLSNGVQIPCVGFGTWQTPDGDVCVSSVLSAIESGYRHIDTAQGYGNEESVGIAVKKSGLPREELFITSKLTNTEHGYEKTHLAFEATMKKLDMDYLDLFLIHWPNPIAFRDHWQEANTGTWKAFEELYKAGRIKAIGVSNFLPHHITELMRTATIAPMVNQIRLCPGDTQEEVVNFSREMDMVLEAYSPLGVGKIFEVEEMKEFSKKYGKSIAQICLRWSLQRGYLPLPKSVTPSRIKENTEIFDFTLEASDVELIAGLTGCVGLHADPDKTTF